MSKEVEFPTVELVQKYIDKFDNDRDLVLVEDVLSELPSVTTMNGPL